MLRHSKRRMRCLFLDVLPQHVVAACLQAVSPHAVEARRYSAHVPGDQPNRLLLDHAPLHAAAELRQLPEPARRSRAVALCRRQGAARRPKQLRSRVRTAVHPLLAEQLSTYANLLCIAQVHCAFLRLRHFPQREFIRL